MELLNPVIGCRVIGEGSQLEEGRVISIVHYELCLVVGQIDHIVVGEFCHKEEGHSVVLLVVRIAVEVLF